ncbi:MAG: hypothetical protein WCG21_11805 [Eubacteriales bacterium]
MTKDITVRRRIRYLLECLLLIGILAGVGYLFYSFIWPWIRIFCMIYGGESW